MLIVSRKPGQAVTIDIGPDVDPAMTVAELFGDGPIEVAVAHVSRSRIRLAIAAPNELSVCRAEQYGRAATVPVATDATPGYDAGFTATLTSIRPILQDPLK